MPGAKQRIFVQIGERFGKLVVQSTNARVGVTASKPFGWRAAVCLCDCGNVVTVALSRLAATAAGRPSGTKSCGCWKGEFNLKHGLASHPLRKTHMGMMRRCYSPDADQFGGYGARGITVCERWHDLAGFVHGVEAEIGPRPEGKTPGGMPVYTLDRIDNDGNYEPGNVRWATALEQQANTRRPPRAQCSEDGCQRLVKCLGLCSLHYERLRKSRARA